MGLAWSSHGSISDVERHVRETGDAYLVPDQWEGIRYGFHRPVGIERRDGPRWWLLCRIDRLSQRTRWEWQWSPWRSDRDHGLNAAIDKAAMYAGRDWRPMPQPGIPAHVLNDSQAPNGGIHGQD